MPGPSHYLVNKLAYKKEVKTYQLHLVLVLYKVFLFVLTSLALGRAA